MLNRKLVFSCTFALAVVLLTAANSLAQGAGVFTGDLLTPMKLIATQGGSLVVAEAGTTANTGRISIIDAQGNRRTLIDGLPSGIAPPEGAPTGPSGLALRGRTLYVTIGEGNAMIAGAAPGTVRPNPTPSSPLFSAVLAIELSTSIEATTGGFSLTLANHTTLKAGSVVRLTNAAGERANVLLVADFRDFTYETAPNGAESYRPSNPFGAAVDRDTLYVVDAGQNLVRQIDLVDRDVRDFSVFGRKPNPTTIGPPFVEPVPTSVRVFGNRVLVTLLTGFPFAPGNAEVRQVNRVNNSQTTFIGGLNSAIDVAVVTAANGQEQFYVLEFSTNQLAEAPGRLLFFASRNATPTVVADNLISPTSLARDPVTGNLFITQAFTGQVVRVQAP